MGFSFGRRDFNDCQKIVFKSLATIFLFVMPAQANLLKGTAKSPEGKVLYSEEHKIVRDSNGLSKSISTTYHDVNGKKIASFHSNFSGHKFVPDSTFEDIRMSLKLEGKASENGKYLIQSFAPDGEVKSKNVSLHLDMISGQGFDNFIKENFVDKDVKKLDVKFLVLPRKDYYQFEVERLSSANPELEHYRIKPSSFMVRLFVKEIDLYYSKKTGMLKRYVGLSNLPDEKNQPQIVDIEYTHHEQHAAN